MKTPKGVGASCRGMTKVEAVKKVLEDMEGQAPWETIYKGVKRYYKGADASGAWKEGIRGVVYREIRAGVTFVMVSKGVVGLREEEQLHSHDWNHISDHVRECTECGDIDRY